MALDEALIADLKKKHGPDLAYVKLGEHEFVLRPLDTAEFQQVVDMSNDDRKKSHAPKRAAELALVYPDEGARAAIFARKPGYLIKLGEQAFELAGLMVEAEAKKLLAPSRRPGGLTTSRPPRRRSSRSSRASGGVAPRSARSCSPSSSPTPGARRAGAGEFGA